MQFREAKCIHFDEPQELAMKCIIEYHYNKITEQLPQGMSILFRPEESHDHQTEYIEWMKVHEFRMFADKDDINEILNKTYISRMDNYEKMINGAIDNYIELSKVSLSELDSAYGNMNFIFANNSIRSKAYNEIFNKLRLLKQKILEEAYHFNLYKNGKGNFAVCAQKALEVSKSLFMEEKTKKDIFDSIRVYQKQFDDIEESLENFRVKIYYKEKEASIERER